MTAWLITSDGRGFLHHGRYTSEDGAIRGLLKRIGECIDVHLIGAEREPREITAEWMMGNCRELTVY